jgi:hypothetical protein
MTILVGPKTASRIAYELGTASPAIMGANLVRLQHLGIVEVVAHDLDGINCGKWDVQLWGMTRHGLEHKQIVSGCWACRIRMRYLAADEALIE